MLIEEDVKIICIGTHEENYDEMVEFLKPHAIFIGDFGDPGDGFRFVVGHIAAQMFFKKFKIYTFKNEPMFDPYEVPASSRRTK